MQAINHDLYTKYIYVYYGIRIIVFEIQRNY
jgi:hypothetical protein